MTRAGLSQRCRRDLGEGSPLWGSNPRPYAYGAHALPAELRRHPGSFKERLMRRMLFWATQGRTCAWRPFCLVRAADGQQDRLAAAEKRLARAAPGPHLPRPLGGRRLEQITQQAGRLMRGVAAHWWHLALSARANTAHLPLSCSPLRGLSPRPYAYGAHALPAELRRHPATCKERLI